MRDRQRLLERQLLVAHRAEDDVGGHQLGQRRRVDRRVGVALGERLVGGQVEQQVALARATSGGCGACATASVARRRRAGRRRRGEGRAGIGIERVRSEAEGGVRQRRARAVHARATFFSSVSCPWKKWPTPGNDDHRQRLRPRPVERRRERHDVVDLAVDDQRCRPAPPASSKLLGRRADQHQPRAACRPRAAGRRRWRRRSRRTRSRPAAAAGRRTRCARAARRSTASASSTSPRPSSQAPAGRADAAEVEAHAGASRAAGRRAPASARPCCPSCRRTADADGRRPRRRAAPPPAGRCAHSMRAGRAGDRLRDRARVHRGARLSGRRRRQQQALDDLALLQVRIDDLVDVVLVDIGVPGGVGIDHRDRAAGAAVQAAGLVDADPARPGEALGLDARLAVVEARLGVVVGAASSRRSRAG